MMGPSIKIIAFTLLIVQGRGLHESVIFNRNLAGVQFNPPEYYTIQNVKTLLEVVCTRFSKIFTFSVGAPYKGLYWRNITYYHDAKVIARTAEMAAHINREKNNLSLTVMVGIWHWETNQRGTILQIDVALEAVQIANSIFPRTVERLLLYDWYSLEKLPKAKELLKTIQILRNKTSTKSGLQIGIRQMCDLRKSILDADSIEFLEVKKEIIQNLDFIMCSTSPGSAREGAIRTFNALQSHMLTERFKIKSINSDIEVMQNTRWTVAIKPPGKENAKYDNDNLRDYWVQADKFATQHKYPMWLSDVIRYRTYTMGWWTLLDHNLINNASGYVETISDEVGTVTGHKQGREVNARIETTTKLPIEPSIDLGIPVINDSVHADDNNIKGRDSQSSWHFKEIITGTIASVSIVAGLVFMIFKIWSSYRARVLTKQEIYEFRHGLGESLEQTGDDDSFVNMVALKLPYDSSLEIPKQNLEILSNQVLGGGEFGCVFKALIRDEFNNVKEVALKIAKPNGGPIATKGILSEIKILSYLGRHPNIVPIIGAYTVEMHKGTASLATEFCPLGSLKTCLKNYRDSMRPLDISSVPFHDMFRWSYEIACGMEYLEEKRVIHADLATRNVLLSSACTAKISDFGLSRRLYEYTSYTKTQQEPLPWRWMAFESLKAMEFSAKSDVWSYGVTLWEIFSLGAQPYPGLAWNPDFVETIEDGFRLSKPRYATSEIFEIMENCWKLDREARPTFTELKNRARDIQINATEFLYTSLNTSVNIV